MLLYLLGIWTAAAPDDVTSEGLTRALQPDPRFEQLSATLWRLRTTLFEQMPVSGPDQAVPRAVQAPPLKAARVVPVTVLPAPTAPVMPTGTAPSGITDCP